MTILTIQPMIITFIILLGTIFLFSQNRFRPDVIAGGAVLLLTILEIITPEEALSGFSNSTVIMIAGLFVVGAGIFESGFALNVGQSLLKFGKDSENRALFIVILTVSLFSALFSTSGTVAFLLPVIISISLKLSMNPSRFLLPLAFASSLGGLLTIIGSTSTLLVSDALKRAGYEKFGFFSITGIGIVALAAGVLFMMTIGRRLVPKNEEIISGDDRDISSGELAGIYKTHDRLHFVYIPETSDIVGERLADLKLPSQFGITVIEIDRMGIDQEEMTSSIAGPDEVLYPHDLLLVFGGEEEIAHFTETYELEQKASEPEDIKAHFLTKAYGLTEIIIAPHSSLEEQTIEDVHFREKYSCSVLAINRKGTYIQTGLAKEKLKIGDALLVHGKWENIQMLSDNNRDVVVLGSVTDESSMPKLHGKAPIATMIFALMLGLMIFEVVPFVVSVLIAAFLMIVTGCVRSVEEAYKSINLDAVVLMAALLPMATALEKTGGAQFISNGVIDLFGNQSPYILLIGFYLAASLFSYVMNSMATAIILSPIAITVASNLGISPYPFVVGIAVAASIAFATPVASQTNTMVLTAGGYKFNDFVRAGLPLQLFVATVVLIFIPIFFPFVSN